MTTFSKEELRFLGLDHHYISQGWLDLAHKHPRRCFACAEEHAYWQKLHDEGKGRNRHFASSDGPPWGHRYRGKMGEQWFSNWMFNRPYDWTPQTKGDRGADAYVNLLGPDKMKRLKVPIDIKTVPGYRETLYVNPEALDCEAARGYLKVFIMVAWDLGNPEVVKPRGWIWGSHLKEICPTPENTTGRRSTSGESVDHYHCTRGQLNDDINELAKRTWMDKQMF